ncbi:MAG: D-ornithine 4,5-aminomutase subunit OraE [Defluviitaleaceae bacterium]|nr:D-ornithine 4,5-aminomutase subunit OraE [Defluviitaleaceae bacterium]MCL2239928.1 D-ornithine 4,5-aminomutase subunit OraE [Defluviitaleaceae bacterium]
MRLNIEKILENLKDYRPRRRGWTWRKSATDLQMDAFTYREISEPLKESVPLITAHNFNNIDPQPLPVITTEIASGRFEDDIRRMRMAAHHGADHIMVIRTAGQSHFDGLLEGTPQGIGGVPITRKQVRAQRKALDFIEDEVGRPINYHSYVSGVAGPDIAVMFAEEGVNGVHQDPQYNVIYRNINMVRSFVDACESKMLIKWANQAQIDGAHNANATARDAWKVMPELMVQHAINSLFSHKVGIPKENICLSTVPPTSTPAPSIFMDLPYAVALRQLFAGYRMRAQMHTKYIQSSTREATVTHVLNMLISKLTSVDIQSTITPDEGRNVPWHMYNIEACDTAKQALLAMDGIMDLVELKTDGPLAAKVRELQERAVLFMEEMVELGGYFAAVEAGFFVDSGCYPERGGDGIRREMNGGIGAGSVVPREKDYFAPVTAHYGYNNVAQYDPGAENDPANLIGGCTLEDPEKIIYIDELDETDNVNERMKDLKPYHAGTKLRPEMEWMADGTVLINLCFPTDVRRAEAAALECAKAMNLTEAAIISREILHHAEGTRIEMKGKLSIDIDTASLVLAPEPDILSDDEIRAAIDAQPLTIVCGTVGEDEHSVGLREIIDIKHGGIEKYGIKVHYLGTSVPVEKLLGAAVELNAQAVLASVIISHDDIHYKNIAAIDRLAKEMGIREKIIFVAGGTQVAPESAVAHGADAGFGRGTKGAHVATFLVKQRKKI